MINYKYSYYYHKQFDGRGSLKDENTTYLTFKQFLTFYTADPENWHSYTEKQRYYISFFDSYDSTLFFIPFYINEKKEKRYIKFLTKRDYKKFVKFFRNNAKNGLDYENQKEILELSQSIQKRASQKLLEAQKEVQKAYDEHRALVEKTILSLDNKNSWISTFQETNKMKEEDK